jgi:hypothetical protein
MTLWLGKNSLFLVVFLSFVSGSGCPLASCLLGVGFWRCFLATRL